MRPTRKGIFSNHLTSTEESEKGENKRKRMEKQSRLGQSRHLYHQSYLVDVRTATMGYGQQRAGICEPATIFRIKDKQNHKISESEGTWKNHLLRPSYFTDDKIKVQRGWSGLFKDSQPSGGIAGIWNPSSLTIFPFIILNSSLLIRMVKTWPITF